MKGPFGLLLLGGGIILIVGLFTGKIVFPGVTGSQGTSANPVFQGATGANPIVKGKPSIVPPSPNTASGTCPPGYVKMPVTGGGVICYLKA